METLSKADIDMSCQARLKAQGVPIQARSLRSRVEPRTASILLEGSTGMKSYRVEITKNLNSSDLHRIRCLRTAFNDPLLVVTRHVTRQRAKLFFDEGVEFVDVGGNMNLNLPGFKLRISGEPLPPGFDAPPRPRQWRESTVRGAFAILLHSFEVGDDWLPLKVGWIAKQAKISVGSASKVRKDLEAMDHLTKDKKGYLVLEREAFVDDWVDAYARILYPNLLIRSVRMTDLELTGIWGGESAAQRTTHYLCPGQETLYINEPTSAWTLRHAGQIAHAEYSGRHHEVALRKLFWQPKPNAELTPSLLTFADLMASEEGRNIEVARMVRAEFLQPKFN